MALKLHFRFPIFAPPTLNPDPTHRPPTEIRFSRWNNANAEKFNSCRRSQQEIEDEIRRERRFNSAAKIAESSETSAVAPSETTFKSIGTPSSPSKPSIPGKKSKYSKDTDSHPAFRPISRVKKGQVGRREEPIDKQASIAIGEDGVSYVIDGAPFEFKYSYTESPKVRPIKLREPPFAPFGPTTMPRPWTGRAPLPASKKKLKEFDSFELPPAGKKGVKPVQPPGPFLPGTVPRYVYSREEILGEPLTEEEIKDLVKSCIKSRRQLNMGRDGLTHNMLDNIHALWKRRRVCKIKCKGVCTVDMDNVCEQLEERTGGKIVYRKDGVLFLFRGRNYNYKTRPRFPLMLWKPASPVYPTLIKRVPEGLTLEEATEMRKKGRKLMPICKLAKNGVYCSLVKNVREAFEACELVRVNCQGLNKSDYRKIGAKLRDLVPCVLLSFDDEHILMWRGRDWKSTLLEPDGDSNEAAKSEIDGATSLLTDQELPTSNAQTISDGACKTSTTSLPSKLPEDMGLDKSEGPLTSPVEIIEPSTASEGVSTLAEAHENKTELDSTGQAYEESSVLNNSNGTKPIFDEADCGDDKAEGINYASGFESLADNTGCGNIVPDAMMTDNQLESSVQPSGSSTCCTEGILLLLNQAVETGSAVILDNASLDADIVYERAVAFSRTAPPGPVFRYRPKAKKVLVKKPEREESEDTDGMENEAVIPDRKGSRRRGSKVQRKRDLDEHHLGMVPRGSLRVDELAKLLA